MKGFSEVGGRHGGRGLAGRCLALIDGIAMAGRKPRTILLSIIVLLVGAGLVTWLSLTWAGHDRALLPQGHSISRLLKNG